MGLEKSLQGQRADAELAYVLHNGMMHLVYHTTVDYRNAEGAQRNLLPPSGPRRRGE